MKRTIILLAIIAVGFSGIFSKLKAGDGDKKKTTSNPPIYIAFLWHMHQPIYWPYESVVQTDQNGRYPFSVADIHNQRTGPYTGWPKDAVQKGISANLPHFGAQVSFTGSLIENLNALEANGNGNFSNWKSHWNTARQNKTSLNNPRMDMVAFGYFHPLMGLIDYLDIRKQIQKHKEIFSQNFPGSYSKGMFPPENAFSERMIPALKDEGIEWVLVDNLHFDRAASGYPFTTGGNVYEMNKADIRNPNPNDWVQLNGLWAPTRNSAKWGRQPHFAEYIDPQTGQSSRMIVVPADRYMGNEDGRGGFGALNYEAVMSQLESYNTDPAHPILVVLHHDGDNYGGGTEGYYGGNFQGFVNWVKSNSTRFQCTTIQDYLQMFPPATEDVIHVESGSWSGADNGDPEFKKWLGDPGSDGYSPDINSWGVITAAKNYVFTAESVSPSNANTLNAWKYLMVGEASDYWYWDGSLNGIWDSHPTRAANQAVAAAQQVIQGQTDNVAPTIFLPQRKPYNPGGTEWNINQTKDFKVWTYIFDVSGIKSAKLKYRTILDTTNQAISGDNMTYIGGPKVSAWTEINLSGVTKVSTTNPAPIVKAKEYSAMISGFSDRMVDYYIEAVDSVNNVAKSPIQHVWVGSNNGSGGGTGNTTVSWTPNNVTVNDTITIKISNASQGALLHWGVNNVGSVWQTPNQVYWPAGTTLFSGTGPAVQSQMTGPDTAGNLYIKIGPFNNAAQTISRVTFVIHYNDNTWNNNNGQDFKIEFGGSSGGGTFVLNGQLDPHAVSVSANNGKNLFLGFNGTELYVATESAQSQANDVFIFVTDSLRAPVAAPWAKTGQVVGSKLFLANESSNNWCGWTNQSSSPLAAAGTIVAGTINIQNEFGYIPPSLYIAVGAYQTQDAGALVNQVPLGNGNGNIEANEFYKFNYVLTGVKDERKVPDKYLLSQNYPNPFNPETVIQFQIPIQGQVALRVYDILGREVAVLINEEKQAGTYSVKFKGDNLSSGMYFFKLEAAGYSETRKMTLMK